MIDLDTHIKAEAAIHHLPWALVKAICIVESSLNPFAMRYEPRYKWLYGDANVLSPTERHAQMCSWGLMQVMGAVARERGFPPARFLTELCIIPVGLTYGCLHLAHYQAKYDLWAEAVAAYNAGSPRRKPDGAYENQHYVEKVFTEWSKLDPNHSIIIEPGSESKPHFLERSK